MKSSKTNLESPIGGKWYARFDEDQTGQVQYTRWEMVQYTPWEMVQYTPWESRIGQLLRTCSQFKNNYFAEMCSGSEAGSYLRLIDNSRLESNKEET